MTNIEAMKKEIDVLLVAAESVTNDNLYDAVGNLKAAVELVNKIGKFGEVNISIDVIITCNDTGKQEHVPSSMDLSGEWLCDAQELLDVARSYIGWAKENGEEAFDTYSAHAFLSNTLHLMADADTEM